MPKPVRKISAWISIIMGRLPSMAAVITEPDACAETSEIRYSEGFGTSRRPFPAISNTPISLVEPKRFLMPRRMR